MYYFRVSPEAPFGLGENAEFGDSPSASLGGRNPLLVADLVLYRLPIPDLTTITPVYLTTPALADALKDSTGLSGRPFMLAFDEQMKELGEFEGKDLPDLRCFDVTGTFGSDDFVIAEGVAGVLVSERALDVLRRFDLGIARVVPYVA